MALQGDNSTCAKPPVDFKSKVPLWPGQARAGQAKTELYFLKSTGGLAQVELSPCIFGLTSGMTLQLRTMQATFTEELQLEIGIETFDLTVN